MKRVLILGGDASLISIRADLLRRFGFDAESQLVPTPAEDVSAVSKPDLIILCSSLTSERRPAVRKSVDRQFPEVPVLTILRAAENVQDNASVVGIAEGPARIVELCILLTKI